MLRPRSAPVLTIGILNTLLGCLMAVGGGLVVIAARATARVTTDEAPIPDPEIARALASLTNTSIDVMLMGVGGAGLGLLVAAGGIGLLRGAAWGYGITSVIAAASIIGTIIGVALSLGPIFGLVDAPPRVPDLHVEYWILVLVVLFSSTKRGDHAASAREPA